MKTTMKKLAVFGMIVTIAMFTVVAMASAGDNRWNTIIGEYGFSGAGNCIITPITNWNTTTNTIIDPALASGNSYNAYGVFTLQPHGQGHITLTIVSTPVPPAWSPSSLTISYPFTYDVKDDGEFTLAAVPNTFTQTQTYPPPPVTLYRDNYSLTGYVSADGNTITLATPAVETDSLSLTPGGAPIVKLICHDSHVGIRLRY